MVYSILDVKITDEELFHEYVAGHLPTVAQYGGKFLVAGGGHEAIEGDWIPHTMVMHEWPDKDAFERWYDSIEYEPWRAMRQHACSTDFVVVQGV